MLVSFAGLGQFGDSGFQIFQVFFLALTERTLRSTILCLTFLVERQQLISIE